VLSSDFVITFGPRLQWSSPRYRSMRTSISLFICHF